MEKELTVLSQNGYLTTLVDMSMHIGALVQSSDSFPEHIDSRDLVDAIPIWAQAFTEETQVLTEQKLHDEFSLIKTYPVEPGKGPVKDVTYLEAVDKYAAACLQEFINTY